MDDTKWFIGFLLVFGIIWLTGKTNPIKLPTTTATSTPKTYTVSAPAKNSPKTVSPSSKTSVPPPQADEVIYQTPSADTASTNLSPLRGALTITTLSRGTTVDREYIVIQASTKNSRDIDISGLTIRSRVSLNGQTIGKGWKLYFPENVGGTDPIRLQPGNRAYLISGRSPMGVFTSGDGFEVNRCSGFLSKGTSFSPSLPLTCPSPKDYPLPLPPNALSDACYDFVKTIPRCTVPTSIPKSLQSDGSCQSFVFNRINYNQCVTNFKDSPRFFSGEWRVYFGRSTTLWRTTREIIELVDADGKLIDSRQYGY